jgi:hypothetical protein
MKAFATLLPAERRDLLLTLAEQSGLPAVILEKDFWVSWLLECVFARPELGDTAVFKGGTSLSKVFRAIARFSEDVDLGISPASLGWSEDELEAASKNAWTERLRPQLEAACARRVEEHWLPILGSELLRRLGPAPGGVAWLHYRLDAASYSPVLFFAYPGALPEGVGYIAREVRIEFGALTDQRPVGRHRIAALVAELAPGVFTDASAEVVALEIERTFWEKATILHAEHHRPIAKPMPSRYARHYADFAALWRHPSTPEASRRLDLLARVRKHKARFFASSWANYPTAMPGSLRLAPPTFRLAELRADYGAMQPMFLDTPLAFDEMIAVLREAEETLNRV